MPLRSASVALQLPDNKLTDNRDRSVVQRSGYLLTPGAYTAGSVGPIIDLLDNTSFRAELDFATVSGTNPTFDCTLIHSADCKAWYQLGTAFTQETGAFGSLSAVTEAGTTPPDITLTGTAVREVNFKATVKTTGARGTAVLNLYLDGGVWKAREWTTAATYLLLDEDDVSTGITLAYENASASADNTWVFRTLGRQRKVFSGCHRYVRAVYAIGGTESPTFTGSIAIRTGD
jgi:hypothetical protein